MHKPYRWGDKAPPAAQHLRARRRSRSTQIGATSNDVAIQGRGGLDVVGFAGLAPGLAQEALPVTLTVVDQNTLLAGIEARLAEEVRGFARTVAEFGLRTKTIREEIPESAKFCKLVSGFFPLVAFQISDALVRSPQGFTFQDDGALYLQQLGLELKDFVREVNLEGRNFLAVAFLDKRGRNVLDGAANRDEL